jgi:gamma-butyrobetaine dioxygenase
MTRHDDTRPALSPDFIDHPDGPPIINAAYDGPTLTLVWDDGITGRFNRFYLRENDVGSAINPVTRESDLDIDALPDDLAITDAEIEGATVSVTWGPDGHRSRHHAGWLRFVATDQWHPRAALPERRTWAGDDMAEPVTFPGPPVLTDDAALRDWLSAVESFGLARLRDLPTDEGTVLRVAERIGTIRNSNFGFSFFVESKPDPDSNAYTAAALSPHTDLGTRELQPGLQLLHCRENSSTGGESTMVDGFRVAEVLRDTDPKAFKILSTRNWMFSNRHRDTDYRWSGPIIVLGDDGELIEIRNTAFLRAEPDMPAAEIDAAYGAYRAYMRLASQDNMTCRYPFAAGDLVMFDNRRILHGRAAFDPQSGTRRLEGCYLDRDELHSRLRVLARP